MTRRRKRGHPVAALAAAIACVSMSGPLACSGAPPPRKHARGIPKAPLSGKRPVTERESTVAIKPDRCAIRVPGEADSSKRFAAQELRKHLALITGVQMQILEGNRPDAGRYVFHVGIRAPDDTAPLAKEEARYQIRDGGAYLYGDDAIRQDSGSAIRDVLNERHNRVGTLFAVYAFLENALGVRWIEPGEGGIVFRRGSPLRLTRTKHAWVPRLMQRHLRSNSWRWKDHKDSSAPQAFRLTREEVKRKDREEKLWLRRMRMGRSLVLRYGHAFTRWWQRYGKEHPEWFAQGPEGKRNLWANSGKPDRVKMCVSNRQLHKEIVRRWLEARKQDPTSNETLNACENDSRGYCRCPECVALDVRRPGEDLRDHLSDRYIWFTNALLAEARRHVPDARVVMYAYSDYKYPPRREKVSPGVVIGFVPGGSPEVIDRMYKAWRAAGATEMFLRPNDMHADTGMPVGFDREMYERFEVGIRNGIIGTDYDSLHSFWPVSGLGTYAIARGHVHPGRSFDHWEDEYCSAFGKASADVKEYYQYWRHLRRERLHPHRAEIKKRGRYGNFRRGLFWLLERFYKEEDFDRTDALLSRGLDRGLEDDQKRRLENLLLANRHARLMLHAIAASNAAKGERGPEAAQRRLACARELLQFRTRHRDDLAMAWGRLFAIERRFGDIASVLWASLFRDTTPVKALSLYWHFRIDERDEGSTQGWHRESWKAIRTWPRIRTDRFWEQQVKIDSQLKKRLSDYDGIGWYATQLNLDEGLKGKEVYLTFGAVDESCWVFVNGTKVGERVFKNPDDWKLPFSVRIDAGFSSGGRQVLVVKVEDKGGAGGIWRQVWVTTRERPGTPPGTQNEGI